MFENLKAKKIIIIGGVAGGMSAAARARRLSEESEIIVLERSGHVSFANCGLPYFLGREIRSREDLILQTPLSLKERFNLDVRVMAEVVEIDTQNKMVKVNDSRNSTIYVESYDELVLSVGASPLKPPLPGIDLPGIFTLRNIEDIDRLESWFSAKRPRNAVIVGGGLIGLEVAEQLLRRGLSITVVEGQDQLLPPSDPEFARLAQTELQKHGIKVVLNSFIKEFRTPAGTSVAAPASCFVVAGEHEPIAADLVILGLGVRPEVALARKSGLAIGQRGGILVDQYMQTSVPDVWAIGDAVEVVQPLTGQQTLAALGGPANRQGRIAADNIFGLKRSYSGTLGTAIVRVFELSIAMAGLNEKQLKAGSIPYEAAHLHPLHHAGYYPGAERLDIKILFHKESHEILGAQVAGKQGVDKRIDVLATAIKGRLTIAQLSELELSYAPPFGSAKDPVNLAGMIGTNILAGLNEQADWRDVAGLDPQKYCLLDVRSDKERQAGFVPDSLHIPLPELRKRLAELPRSKTLLVYCQSGQRSYFATRVLSQTGFQVKNLSGGYLTWQSVIGNASSNGGGSDQATCCGQSGNGADNGQITAEGLRALCCAREKLTIVDVRSPAEFDSENIDGSINLPLAELPGQLDRFSTAEPIVVVCRSGLRALRAAAILAGNGYEDVRVLNGGLMSWRKAGFPVNKGRECLPVERQTQLVIGFVVLSTVLLAVFGSKVFLAVTGFFGAGLMFAGLTGNCALALLIARAPWNTSSQSVPPPGVQQPVTEMGGCCR